ncbi:hypothetical protein [Bacillus suaedae]|uniref:Uncharacterized protein n=1 Tax=Halalkalibacter suaedae TaxID=2822140 RepID=A0A940WNA2_9BACI|nr:hypothetical protein [Bacillus suaedae]MBP3949535.1 hypothetical protein [Bacillus suaedae]
MYQNRPPHHNPYNMNTQQHYQQQAPPPPPYRPPSKSENKRKSHITPNTLAVIAALLTNALEVQSILVDKDKTIQVLLEGSLRVQQKSELDRIVDQVRDVPVGDFISSLLNEK